MPRVKIVDPATSARDGWHEVYGNSADALNGNVSRVFLAEVPQSVPTTMCRQPDGWSCGPYSLAECLGQSDGEAARQWLLARGLITPEYGTDYAGIVGYLKSCGYGCEYDGRAHDGEMDTEIFQKLINHLQSGKKAILCMHGTSKGCRTNYWTYSGHYICVYGIDGAGIEIDGKWGCATTKLAQKLFGTTQDGIISNQNKAMKPHLPNAMTASWKFVAESKLKNGSELIRAIQKFIGVTADGFFGMVSIVAFQKWLNVTPDGYVGGETVKAFQRWLNNHI